MIDGATVVWLTPGVTEERAQAQTSPREDARRALEAWAQSRGVALRAPGAEGAEATAIDWGAGDEVERDLGLSRDALAGLDFDTAERELARAEAVLRDHPELPQAAWLRAEVERAWSARWLREGDEARARLAWQRGAALGGSRVAGLAEKAFDPAPTVTATIALTGGGALRLDGVGVSPGDVTRGEGEHALEIVRGDGAVVWAAWVGLAQGASIRVNAPEAEACSLEDVERARLVGGSVRASGVRCGRWVAAVSLDEKRGAIRVATCAGAACGPLVEWRPLEPAERKPGQGSVAEVHHGWPAWATWTLAGIGVAGATVAIVAAAGAFKSAPNETQFVNGGLQVHSFRGF